MKNHSLCRRTPACHNQGAGISPSIAEKECQKWIG